MRAHYKRDLFDSQPLVFTNVAKFVPPEIRHLNRQTDRQTDRRTQIEISTIHRSGRKTGSSGLWENHVVKNSVLPRWRSAATRHFVHAKRRDREPSIILMKKLAHLMSKNKTKRHKIKRFIKQYILKSSSSHNLLSTRFRKYVSQKPTNVNM